VIRVVVETNQNNVDHHKVGSIYGGRGLDWYTGLNKKYIDIIICRATYNDIDKVIDADIPSSIFYGQLKQVILGQLPIFLGDTMSIPSRIKKWLWVGSRARSNKEEWALTSKTPWRGLASHTNTRRQQTTKGSYDYGVDLW